MSNENAREHILVTIKKFIIVPKLAESRHALVQNPELLSPVAVEILNELIERTSEQTYKKRITWFRDLLQRCIDVGIDQAYLEKLSELFNLGTELFELYRNTLDLSALDHAINLLEDARDLASPNQRDRDIILNRLGLCLYSRYTKKGCSSDLTKAIEAFEEALALSPANSPDALIYLNNLGSSLNSRYYSNGDIQDLEQAIEYLEKAVQNTPNNSEELPERLANLGRALKGRYDRFSDRSDAHADLERAIQVLEKARTESLPEFSNAHVILSHLGVLYRVKARTSTGAFDDSSALDHLKRSICLLNQAVLKCPPHSPNLPGYFSNLGISLRTRYQILHQTPDLEKAIEFFQKAVKLIPSESPDSPRALKNLANGLQLRYIDSCDAADLEAAVSNYERAASTALNSQTEMALNSARDWLYWAFSRKSWEEVVRAYQYIEAASMRLVPIQVFRQGKEAWLKEVQGLAGRGAYAMTKLGDPKGAVIALEGSLAQLLSEALRYDRVELEKLKTTKDQGLYERYLSTVEQISRMHARTELSILNKESSPQTLGLATELRAKHNELDDIISAIRQVPGYERFLCAPTFDDVQDAAREKALVYIVVTEVGSLGLIVMPNTITLSNDHVLWLDDFRLENLKSILLEGFLEGAVSGESAILMQVLHEAFPVLDRQLMAPLIEHLNNSGCQNAVLIPTGILDLLPLHAVSAKAVIFSYTPSARALAAAYKMDDKKRSLLNANEDNGTNIRQLVLLAIGNPLPNRQPLDFARKEIEEIVSMFPHETEVRDFCDFEAVLKKVLDAIPGATHLHFACHGNFSVTDPLNSSLFLSGNDKLTLLNLLYGGLDLSAARFAVLSACQTGIKEFHTVPDEAVGFPAGFLQAGVPTVVSTLWPVDDVSTSLLMAHFYQVQFKNHLSPSQALCESQEWLRERVNRRFVINYITSLVSNLERQQSESPFGREALAVKLQTDRLRKHIEKLEEDEARNPGGKPFANPFYWAAFLVAGADTRI